MRTHEFSAILCVDGGERGSGGKERHSPCWGTACKILSTHLYRKYDTVNQNPQPLDRRKRRADLRRALALIVGDGEEVDNHASCASHRAEDQRGEQRSPPPVENLCDGGAAPAPASRGKQGTKRFMKKSVTCVVGLLAESGITHGNAEHKPAARAAFRGTLPG